MTRRDTEDDYWWLMTDYWLSSHGQHGWNGGPQADGRGERKLKRINRELKEMGPQADGGEQVSINDDWWMITDGVHTDDADNSKIWQSEFIEHT